MRHVLPIFAVALSLTPTACGGDGGGGREPSESVEDTLDSLGIDTTETPRVDEMGDPLPAEYAPLGSSRTINPFAEIMLFGGQLDDTPTSSGQMPVLDLTPGANNSFSWDRLDDEAPTNTPFFDDRDYPRSASAGDFDRDGHDEIAVIYQEPGEPLHLVVKQDSSEAFALGAPIVISTRTARGVFLAAGDVDGDGDDDLVAAVEVTPAALMAETELYVLTNNEGSFTAGEPTHTLAPIAAGVNHVSLAIGNLDYDNGMETVLALNNTGSDAARYYIYDDVAHQMVDLESGVANLSYGAGQVETAVVVDVAIGDVDGDGTGEVILGGLDYRGNVSTQTPDYLVEVLDDAPHGLVHLAGNRVSSETGGLQPSSSGASQHLRYVHVVAADIDGDGADEIVSNQFVYEDLRQSPGSLVAFQDSSGVVTIPLKDLFADGNAGDDYFFDWDTSDMAAGDVTSDKRDNVVLYSQRLTVSGETQELQVWGVDMINGWSEIADIETTFDNPLNQDGQKQAQILLADLDQDNESLSLEYSEGSYRFVFTEPVVIAVLAAAPCAENLGQDLGESCRTAFGQGVFESMERENGWTFTVGIDVGYKWGFPGGNVEALVETRNTIRNWTIDSYSTTKRVLRETGAIEDSVILTSIPMDIYTYEVSPILTRRSSGRKSRSECRESRSR